MRLYRALLCVLMLLFSAGPLPAITGNGKAIVFDCPKEVFQAQTRMTVVGPGLDFDGLRFEGDTLKLLAVAVEWLQAPDLRPSTYSIDTLTKLLFSHGVMAGGSVAEYFEEVSYGQFHVTGGVHGWVNGGTYIPNADSLLLLLKALDPVIDFSQYDGNNDGAVDAVALILAGPGLQDTQCLSGF